MLKSFNPRKYQLEIFSKACNKNTLVVLPTGLGKTAIAMLVAGKRILDEPDKKIVFVAPTKPLAEQQLEVFKNTFLFDSQLFKLFTGSTSPEKRKEEYVDAKFIFSTPQTIENDLISNNFSLENVSLFVFDEAHRAMGNYAYVFLAKKYMDSSTNPLILALSASPGADKTTIDSVCKNLFIEQIEFKSVDDKSVAEYTQQTDLVWKEVELTSEMNRAVAHLKKSINCKLAKINELGVAKNINTNTNKIDLLKLQHELHSKIALGEKSLDVLQTISVLSELIKLNYMTELLETQSFFAANEYMTDILSKSKISKIKSIQNLARDVNFLSAITIIRKLIDDGEVHPKMSLLKTMLKDLFEKKHDAKVIIFTQFRDTASNLQQILDGICTSKIFFGQGKRKGVGFSQKQQKELLDDFSNNKFQVLIATSVAEEGLDIPSVDNVFFYEPIPSAIRSVQRRGRTGRHSKGSVTILISKGTRDEVYRWSAHHKEKKMFKVLNEMSSNPSNILAEIKETNLEKNSQEKLTSFTSKENSNLVIYVDHREKGSNLVKELLEENVTIKLKQLQVGDFLISSKVIVEFKNVRDFVDSIVDGRLLSQLPSLIQYEKPIILIEGDEDIYSIRNIHPSAIDGMLTTIALTYRIPVFRTKSSKESARLLVAFAKREQLEKTSSFTFHTSKPMEDSSMQEYIVSSFPSIGATLAKKMLKHFDTLESFFKASKEELLQIENLGESKANEILRLKELSYEKSKKQ